MTNDEIEQVARFINLDPITQVDPTRKEWEEVQANIAQAIREAVVQAYEEAAKVVDDWDTSCDGETAARMIRALKNSLTVEETAQERRKEEEPSRIVK